MFIRRYQTFQALRCTFNAPERAKPSRSVYGFQEQKTPTAPSAKPKNKQKRCFKCFALFTWNKLIVTR